MQVEICLILCIVSKKGELQSLQYWLLMSENQTHASMENSMEIKNFQFEEFVYHENIL